MQQLINKSNTSSHFAIKLIPEIFTFIDLYRHTIRPKKGDRKLKLDKQKVSAVINSAMQYKMGTHDRSKTERNFGNHISTLNTFFERLKNNVAEAIDIKTLSKRKLISEDVDYLGGLKMYSENRQNFVKLDNAINNFIDKGGSLIQLIMDEGLDVYDADLPPELRNDNRSGNAQNRNDTQA